MLSDNYFLVRFLLIGLLEEVPDKNFVVSGLLKDKSQKIRQCVISRLLDNEVIELKPILENLLYDNSATVRFESRKLLSKIQAWDFRNRYKENIQRSEFLVGSIMGLSEVGNKEDIPVISEFLEAKNSKISTAALLGLFNLDKDIATETSYQIIKQKYPPKTKKAAELILSNQGIEINRLRSIYDLTDFTGKKVIMRLINKYGGWSAAGDYLKALTENDDKLVQFARISLEAWNKYTIRLGTRQTQEDKDYVFTWYKTVQNLGLQVPDDIPFIFGEKN
jgi:HEAT repeat protein